MQASKSIPLFRTRQAETQDVILQPTPTDDTFFDVVAVDTRRTPEPEPKGWGDLTRWVGATVDGETWEGLQAECKARYGARFAFTAEQVTDGWRVRRFQSAGWQN